MADSVGTASPKNAELLKRKDGKIPLVGLGCFTAWKDYDAMGKAVEAAIDIGYRHFDNAYNYDDEAEVGDALKRCLDSGKVKREDIFVTSKLWNTHHAAADVRKGLEKTLADLKLDYVDLYLVHWPVAFTPESWGGEEPPTGKGSQTSVKEGGVTFNFDIAEGVTLKETWQAMEACVDAGLCKNIGVSNYSISQLKDLLSYARIKPFAHEFEHHPYLTQPKLVEFCKENDIQIIAYSSLGRGTIKNDDQPSLMEDPVVVKVAEEVGRTPGHVLLRWAVQHGVSVIPKSFKPKRLLSNTELNDFELSAAQMDALNALNRGLRFVRPSWHEFTEEI